MLSFAMRCQRSSRPATHLPDRATMDLPDNTRSASELSPNSCSCLTLDSSTPSSPHSSPDLLSPSDSATSTSPPSLIPASASTPSLTDAEARSDFDSDLESDTDAIMPDADTEQMFLLDDLSSAAPPPAYHFKDPLAGGWRPSQCPTDLTVGTIEDAASEHERRQLLREYELRADRSEDARRCSAMYNRYSARYDMHCSARHHHTRGDDRSCMRYSSRYSPYGAPYGRRTSDALMRARAQAEQAAFVRRMRASNVDRRPFAGFLHWHSLDGDDLDDDDGARGSRSRGNANADSSSKSHAVESLADLQDVLAGFWTRVVRCCRRWSPCNLRPVTYIGSDSASRSFRGPVSASQSVRGSATLSRPRASDTTARDRPARDNGSQSIEDPFADPLGWELQTVS